MIAYGRQTLFKVIHFSDIEDMPSRSQKIANENHRLVQEFYSLF